MRLRSLGLIITALVAVAAWGVGTSAEPLGEAGVISLRSLPPLMEDGTCQRK